MMSKSTDHSRVMGYTHDPGVELYRALTGHSDGAPTSDDVSVPIALEDFDVLYQETARACGLLPAEIKLDRKIIRRRTNSEGFPFITVLVSSMLEYHQIGLQEGRLPDLAALRTGFRLEPNSRLPRLFHGFWRRLYDSMGNLRTVDVDFVSVDKHFRQLTSFLSKVEINIGDDVIEAQEDKFVQTDLDLPLPDRPPTDEQWTAVKGSQFVASQVLKEFVFDELIVPTHGPGAVFEGYNPFEKDLGLWLDIPLQLLMFSRETGFDIAYFVGQGGYVTEVLNEILHKLILVPRHDLENEMYSTMLVRDFPRTQYCSASVCEIITQTAHRAIYVPKTVKKKRRIGIEYTILQAMQQGIKRQLQPYLEKWTSRFWPGGIFFTDQTTNQMLAVQGSATGEAVTIDSSEASDRVGLWHIRWVLQPAHERLCSYLLGARSWNSRLHKSFNEEFMTLRKFAGMGAATTFPVESLYFFCVAVHSVAQSIWGEYWWEWSELDPSRNKERFLKAANHVTVYGDDIILSDLDGDKATEFGEFVCHNLELLGGRINKGKSYLTGSFRESCGADALKGVDVTPIKLRQFLPADVTHATQIVSYLETANLLNLAGYTATALIMWDKVCQRLDYNLPYLPQSLAESVGGLAKVVEDTEVNGCWAHLDAMRYYKSPKDGGPSALGYVTIQPRTQKQFAPKLNCELEVHSLRRDTHLSNELPMTLDNVLRTRPLARGVFVEAPDKSVCDVRGSLTLVNKDNEPRKGFVRLSDVHDSRGICSLFADIKPRIIGVKPIWGQVWIDGCLAERLHPDHPVMRGRKKECASSRRS